MTESGNILDNAEVEFLLDAEDGPQPNDHAAESDEAAEQAVTMRGNLDQINLSDIFQTLAMTKMEGVLRVHNPLEQRHVYCQNGFLRILTPPRLIQRRIGQRLVQAGLITPDQLRSALMRQRKERQPIGQILVADGAITDEQIEDIASVQVAEDLFTLFTWRHGAFEFYRGPVTDEDMRERLDGCPEFEVSSLLLEVARRDDEWQTILQTIGNLEELPVRTAEEPPRELNETEYALFRAADGRSTYRQLAEQTTQSLFDVSRVARDLVNEGLLVNLADDAMVEVAAGFTDEGASKQAIMILQTLRDRAHDLELDVVRGIASVLERAGERKLAGLTLLEIAELQSDPETALTMAREACDFAPHDPATIGFLRTTLLAQAGPDDPEVEDVTGRLIDAMLAEDQVDEAITIIEEARSTGEIGPALLLREARVRQRSKDTDGAITAFEEVAELYRDLGETDRVKEALEQILRLDRGRRDVHKQLRKLQQTRTSVLIRLGTAAIALVLLGSMGWVVWQQNRFESAVQEAGQEINNLIQTGDRSTARERLAHWSHVLGPCEEVDDLRRQVDFADAAELQKRNRAAQQRLNDRLVAAAELLDKGQLRSALVIYSDLRSTPDYQARVDEVLNTRLNAVLTDITATAKTMGTRLPGPPTRLMDRRELGNHLAAIQALCEPALYVLVDDLADLSDTGEVPAYLPEGLRSRVQEVQNHSREVFGRARKLAEDYGNAVELADTQRKYDPMFKAALEREKSHDFAGALELFRKLQKSEVNDPELRALFRDRVTRNATICKLTEQLGKATGNGDHNGALQQLKALRLAFPDVPFERLVRLPLRIESRPAGATVRCNGTEIGRTPCTVAYVPADPNQFVIDLQGFRPQEATLDGSESGRLDFALVLEPSHVVAHTNAVDQEPYRDPATGMLVITDRGGDASAVMPGEPAPHWTFKTGDLSGLLSQPFRFEKDIVFASLDGTLRALALADGARSWQLQNLPTETAPILFDRHLAIATTDGRLALVDLAEHSVKDVPIDATRMRLVRAGDQLVVATPEGLSAHAVPSLERVWQRTIQNLVDLHVAATDTAIITVDDRGAVQCLEAATGEPRWQDLVNGRAVAPPMFDGDFALVVSERQITRMLLTDASQRRTIPAPHDGWRGPALVIGQRLLAANSRGEVEVRSSDTAQQLYTIAGSERGTRLLRYGKGAIVAGMGRELHLFPALR
ncbi:MAG: DUF4388 domain-containing protein [bacterium]|nr:DUF4388 domain-containing protein [bacterium]